MQSSNTNNISQIISAEEFTGRELELERLLQHASAKNRERGLLLLHAPANGASELLKQTYKRLFQIPQSTIPIHFAVRKSDRTAKNCARRFLETFVNQTLAYRKQDARSVDFPLILERVDESENEDWINTLINRLQTENQSKDEHLLIRDYLSLPMRVAENARFFLMIDDLHEADFFCDNVDFIAEIKDVFSRSENPFVLAGRRRFLLKKALAGKPSLNDAAILRLDALDDKETGMLTEKLAEKYGLKISEPARDLIVRKFQGNLTLLKSFLQAAREKQINLETFQPVVQLYTDELFGGRIGNFYDSVLNEIAPDFSVQKALVKLFHDSATSEEKKSPIEFWMQHFNCSVQNSQQILSRLDVAEIVRVSSNLIEAMSENEILSDYFAARYRLEIAVETRAVVVGEFLSDLLKRAPRTMAKFYREQGAINLRRLLDKFSHQEIPVNLIDYAVYKNALKAAEEGENSENLNDTAAKIRLPQIVYTTDTESFYPPFARMLERNRSAVAIGFAERAFSDADEVMWLAAQIDSKLEASAETTEFWCDRLEIIALNANFPKYKIWLVAPEGFSDEAAEILKQRAAFGSSRKQTELLAKFLEVESGGAAKTVANEYEFVLPMGENTELIAVNAVEEIARRQQFSAKAVNQIKTATVEACINSAEHSLSPDRKIHLKIVAEKDRMTITVSNRGLRLTDKIAQPSAPTEGRRGWGLKLINTLMDEVKYEQVDDGTRILMTKFLR